MKNKQSGFCLTAAFTLMLSAMFSVSDALPKNSKDNDAYDALLLDGKSVSVEQIYTATRGMLSIASGGPESDQRKEIPFYIYLMRAGKIVDADSYTHNHPVKSVEISHILQSAQAGDQLVIDPAGEGEEKARRVITVKSSQLTPHFNWFNVVNKKGNC